MPERSTLIAIAVVQHEGRFLIGRRPEGVPLAGLWEFPGGKVEPGEAPEQAACRECLEETALRVHVVGEYPAHVQDYPHGRVELRFLACRPLDALAPLREPYRWVPRDELARYEFPEGNRNLLAHLAAPR